ncbi:flagellar hook-associated protein 3 [Alkalilimnicola ehrlichii]|uniref:Flagellar hook-associated protein 3 n=1 Tax=Alkalilimnicola ehrlichii TaxID=351052 RepID=A0A3E0WZ57_9GAMM|nr:flagellar hook-associated protein FlgL [Alkalilimnicola ehrlichii]RFA30732.1 flagellar hook-associated protein 3 [Alkalilimnicola ehrlichii]RFA38308.1 flagellar hook-associated protein 3 [Alkalilimnicola ehrlichii]
MRITTPQITAMMQSSMSQSSAELGRLLQQMATNQRMLMPSDDPISSLRVMRIQREEATLEQYRSNMSKLSGSLSTQETNLSSMSDAVLSVQDLTLWAANVGAHSADDMRSIAGELRILSDAIFDYANVRDEEGRYLFSGTQTDRPAIVFDETADPPYSMGANQAYRQVAVANGVQIEENVTISQALGPDVQLLNDLHDMIVMLEDPALNPRDPDVSDQIKTVLDTITTTHNSLNGSIAELGGRQNSISLLKHSNEDVSLVNQRIENELSSLDYAEASIDLSQYQLALQATQQTFLRIHELSLFSRL